MNLQELANKLSNMLATMPGTTIVHIKVADNQVITNTIETEESKEGRTIVIR